MEQVASPSQAQLALFSRRLDEGFEVREGRDYEQLVVPNGNAREPYHRWFHLKEAFSARLVAHAIKASGVQFGRSLRVLDPFAGSGTTSVSIAEMVGRGDVARATVYGVECNPFLHLLGTSKVEAIRSKPTRFLSIAEQIAERASRMSTVKAHLPLLSTFAKQGHFEPDSLLSLARIRDAIQDNSSCRDGLVRTLSLVCLAASIEPASRLRRDGRALRYEPSKVPVDPIQEFLRRARMVQRDLSADHRPIDGRLIRGDGRTLKALPTHARSFDVALFSPPYPNNIDYTEVYKLENWFLGLINNREQFRNQRLQTLYSHPSLRRPIGVLGESVQKLIQPLVDALPKDRYQGARQAMISGYFSDMRACLQAVHARMKTGGALIYIVGNSAHGSEGAGLVIPADTMIARLAEEIGFTIDRIEIARRPRRRFASNEAVRESVVFARKP